MNFRVSLAAAAAAALCFACADKQATIPELEEASVAPTGMKVVGLYKMTVTPTETSEGVQWALQAIPVGKDGSPVTNPPNTVAVKGNFGSVTTAGPGGCAGRPALTAAVEIKNYTIDPLKNVWVQIVDMRGNTANEACNSSPSTLWPSAFSLADMRKGIWKYNDLAAAPDATGAAAGGISLPISAGGVWGLYYVTTTPFAFYFRVVADDQSPVLATVDPAGPYAPLTWTSAVAANTRLQICASNPGTAKGSPCPVALTVDQPVAGAGVGPWTYSYTPAGLTEGAQYWWRATNIYPAGQSIFTSSWKFFTFAGPPVTVPATFLANVSADPASLVWLEWSTLAARQDTWVVLCAGPCPAVRPVVADPAVLLDQAVAWNFLDLGDGLSHYDVDVKPSDLPGKPQLLTDLSGVYLDATIAYDWRVYDYDGVSAAPAFAALHSVGSLTVTPVANTPAFTAGSVIGTSVAPVVYTLASPTFPLVDWTTVAPITATGFDVVDVADPLNPVVVFSSPPANGTLVTGTYTYPALDLKTTLGANGPGSYMLTIYNADLFGVYGATHFFDVN